MGKNYTPKLYGKVAVNLMKQESVSEENGNLSLNFQHDLV